MSEADPALRVGFIGLGNLGAAMARCIVEGGFPTILWARRPESLVPFADTPAGTAASPADLGAASDVVGVCVVSDADVEDVVLRADGVLAGLAAGGTIVIHSSIHPETCRRIAARAEERGVAVVDAPVSGGAPAAEDRNLLLMVGGQPAHVERCKPVFDTFAGTIVHLGDLGSGQVAKALNNFLFTAHLAIALEMFPFAESLGIDSVALSQVLRKGSGASRAGVILAAGHFDTTGLKHAVPLLQKDAEILADVARDAGATKPDSVAALVALVFDRFCGGA